MAIVRNGTPILQPFVPKLENSYDRVAIFEVNRAELVQSLLQEADRKTLGSIDYVYAGVIPRAALVSVEFVTIDKRVVKIARSIFDPERQHLLVGKDLGKHLKREGFEITPE